MSAHALRLRPTGVARALGFITGLLPPMTIGFCMAIRVIPTGLVPFAVVGLLALLGVGVYRHFAAPVILTDSHVRRWTWFRYGSVERAGRRDSIQIGRFWAPKLGDGHVVEIVRRDGRPVKLWPSADDGLTAVQKRVPSLEAWLHETKSVPICLIGARLR